MNSCASRNELRCSAKSSVAVPLVAAGAVTYDQLSARYVSTTDLAEESSAKLPFSQ